MTDQTATTEPTSALTSPLATGTVVRLDNADAVVLTTGDSEFQVWTKDRVTTLAADTAVEPVADPTQTEPVLRRAVVSLDALRQQAQALLSSAAGQHAVTLSAIRDYAINAHRQGDICETGLNEFLQTFELDEYDPRVSLSYTMAGTATMVGTDGLKGEFWPRLRVWFGPMGLIGKLVPGSSGPIKVIGGGCRRC